jgi:hypothetical protein
MRADSPRARGTRARGGRPTGQLSRRPYGRARPRRRPPRAPRPVRRRRASRSRPSRLPSRPACGGSAAPGRRATSRAARARSGLELVLRDRALLLNRRCPPLERRTVGGRLDAFELGRLERALELGRRPQREHVHRHERHAEILEPAVAREAGREPALDLLDALGDERRERRRREVAQTWPCAVCVRSPASCSSGVPTWRPLSRSIVKSSLAASVSGSETRYVTAPCTAMSWKSDERPWNRNCSSRSSIGTSTAAADSDRNQNASPGPRATGVPLR